MYGSTELFSCTNLVMYFLVSNRQRGWNSRGSEKVSKINRQGAGIIVGLEKI